MISGPRVTLCITLYAREGAAGQAVVCPLLRGRSPTRGVAPKQHRGLGRALTPAFRSFSLYPFGAWVPKNLARRRMVSAGSMLLDRLGPPGLRFNDFRSPRHPLHHPLRARGGCWPGRGLPVATGSLADERGRAKTASGARACSHSGISGWFSLSLWRVGAEESGEAKDGFGRFDAARPARAAWIK